MEKTIEAIAGALSSVSNNMLAFGLVLLAAILYGAYTLISKNFTWFAENWFKPRTQQRHFAKSVEVGSRIQSCIERTLGFCEADRVTVWEFHNGAFNLGGVPFLAGKMTYIACAPGITVTQNLMTSGIPLSALSDFTGEIWANTSNPVSIKKDVRDIKHPLVRSLAVQNGNELTYAAPIGDVYGNAVGMILIGYTDRSASRPDDMEIFHRLGNVAMETSGLLTEIKDKRHLVFWKK